VCRATAMDLSYSIRQYLIDTTSSWQQRKAQQRAVSAYQLTRLLHCSACLLPASISVVKAVPRVVPPNPLNHVAKVQGMCWPIDLDPRNHMNNSRYAREFDFARRKLMGELGINAVIDEINEELMKKTGKSDFFAVVASQGVHHRRGLLLWEQFEVQAALIGWDNRSFYVQHALLLRSKDGQSGEDKENHASVVCATQVLRMGMSGRSAAGERITPRYMLEQLGYGDLPSPSLPPAIQHFKAFSAEYKAQFTADGLLKSNL
jgi:acyl-CoA thioesterase FadM